MGNYYTNTLTFTVIDVRKTFENFLADLRMIARRTGKWDQTYVEKIYNDVLCLAEKHYLRQIDIVLTNVQQTPVKAARYTVSTDGKTMVGARAGNNNWPNTSGTYLSIVLFYNSDWDKLTQQQQQDFQTSNLKISWGPSDIDTSYSHLNKSDGRTYGSNGYELDRENFE